MAVVNVSYVIIVQNMTFSLNINTVKLLHIRNKSFGGFAVCYAVFLFFSFFAVFLFISVFKSIFNIAVNIGLRCRIFSGTHIFFKNTFYRLLSTAVFCRSCVLSTVFRFEHVKVGFVFVYKHLNIFGAPEIVAAVLVRCALLKLIHKAVIFFGVLVLKLLHISVFKVPFEFRKVLDNGFKALCFFARARFRAQAFIIRAQILLLGAQALIAGAQIFITGAHALLCFRKMLILIFFQLFNGVSVILYVPVGKLPVLVCKALSVLIFSGCFNGNISVLNRPFIAVYKGVDVLATSKHTVVKKCFCYA